MENDQRWIAFSLTYEQWKDAIAVQKEQVAKLKTALQNLSDVLESMTLSLSDGLAAQPACAQAIENASAQRQLLEVELKAINEIQMPDRPSTPTLLPQTASDINTNKTNMVNYHTQIEMLRWLGQCVPKAGA